MKVRVSVSSDPSCVLSPVIVTVTFSVGAVSRTTVNVEDPPASVVSKSVPFVALFD